MGTTASFGIAIQARSMSATIMLTDDFVSKVDVLDVLDMKVWTNNFRITCAEEPENGLCNLIKCQITLVPRNPGKYAFHCSEFRLLPERHRVTVVCNAKKGIVVPNVDVTKRVYE